MKRHCLWLVVAPAALGGAVACAGDPKPADPPPQTAQCPPGQYFDGRYCVGQGTNPPPATAPTASTPATSPTSPGPTPTSPVPTATPGPHATPADATVAAAATQLLGPLGTQHAPPGAKPLGAAIAGQFQQGQSLEHQIQMQPGRCYTIVGAAVPASASAVELNLQLVTMNVPVVGSPVAAQDQTTGPTAVIGAKPNCFKWAFPMAGPMRVIVTMASGQGVAAVQIYES